MSGVPAPPPLIPLLLQPQSNRHKSIEIGDSNGSLHDFSKYTNKSIIKLTPILQTGPNCGLAALAMVASLTPNFYSIDDIFNEAKSRGFTHNGEMFSVLNMKTLAEVLLGPWFIIEMFSDGLAVNKSCTIKRLYDGGLMLIPYDADKDHSPCCVSGHKAHWALVCGVMEGVDGEVYVAARHGKSRYLAVWLLDSLQRSNDNLDELDPDKRDHHMYLLPPGGVRAGLASRFIFLTKK